MSLNIRNAEIKAGLIILCAGESARMGEAKQLLLFEGETLLRRAARIAAESSAQGSVVAVLGARAERLERELRGLELEIVFNEDWKRGMSSSIKAGLKRLREKTGNLQAVVITVCDQPYVSKQVIDDLIEKYRRTNAPVVASRYAETLGVPALFDKKLFAELENLTEQGGAKWLIKKYLRQSVSIDFPAGSVDIDTPEDYSSLVADAFLG